jgi:hypothetical protein
MATETNNIYGGDIPDSASVMRASANLNVGNENSTAVTFEIGEEHVMVVNVTSLTGSSTVTVKHQFSFDSGSNWIDGFTTPALDAVGKYRFKLAAQYDASDWNTANTHRVYSVVADTAATFMVYITKD